jgi:hypothetical protein
MTFTGFFLSREIQFYNSMKLITIEDGTIVNKIHELVTNATGMFTWSETHRKIM